MELRYWIILGIVCIGILAYVFRRYAGALVSDYLYDAVLSTADLLLAGFSALGLDIGDWIAAILIFNREKKVMGLIPALIVALEAANFFLSFFPIFGELFEVVLNFFPAALVGRIATNKFGKADKEEAVIEDEVKLAKEEGISSSSFKDKIARVKDLIKHGNPIEALKMEKPLDKNLRKKLIQHVNSLIGEGKKMISSIYASNPQADDETIGILQESLNEAESLLNEATQAEAKKQYRLATDKAKKAKEIVAEAIQQYNQSFQEAA